MLLKVQRFHLDRVFLQFDLNDSGFKHEDAPGPLKEFSGSSFFWPWTEFFYDR